MTPVSILAMQLAQRAPLTATSNWHSAVIALAHIARKIVGDVGGAQRESQGTHSRLLASKGRLLRRLLTITSQVPALDAGQFGLIKAGRRSP